MRELMNPKNAGGRTGTSLADLRGNQFQEIRHAMGGESCQVVLIGEATHGTEEFYRIRADLTKSLLEREGFDAVLCEGDFPPFFEVNRFVGGAPSRRQLLNCNDKQISSEQVEGEQELSVDQAMSGFRDRFPKWMWWNNAMKEFVTWLRDFNANNTTRSLPVQLLGLDIYSLFQSVDQVIDYLVDAGEDDLARLARHRYSTIDSFRPEPSDYGKAVGRTTIQSQARKVARMLTSLYQQEHRLHQIPGNGQELFNAVENARVVAAAETYYRQLYEYVGDDTRQWNLRDSAFLEAIQDVMSYIREGKRELGSENATARIVVWAHNSHVGDARDTEHTSRGQHSIGQLCRQVFGKNHVYIVGFSTYGGTVRAATHWGGHDQVMHLNPAFEASHEYLLHVIAKSRRWNAFGYMLRRNSDRSNSDSSLVDEAARELFKFDRLERFVGVNYLPQTELRSHYSICNMSDQFDYIVHVDHSTALQVDETSTGSPPRSRRWSCWGNVLNPMRLYSGANRLQSCSIESISTPFQVDHGGLPLFFHELLLY